MSRHGTSPDGTPRWEGAREEKGPRLPRPYRRALALAERGRYDEARRHYAKLGAEATESRVQALVVNDRAALAALAGDLESARASIRAALEIDAGCEAARLNAALLAAEWPTPVGTRVAVKPAGPGPDPPASVRVALLSLLFNWPSTGGGTVHTAELAAALAGAGYEVRHFHARYAGWGVGQVTAPTPHPAVPVDFDAGSWTAAAVRDRFRRAVQEFSPDYVIITDSWNTKPLLAEAVGSYPYLLRLQALECLCPLNNVRLLPEPGGGVRQCHLHQLADPGACARCVDARGHLSGELHRAERALAGVGEPDYPERLRRAFAGAEAVLVVNPLAEAMVSPYAQCVRVVTAGMDPARFPGPPPAAPAGRKILLFAGLVDEWMKGFHVLHDACARLWRKRQDFELVATADPACRVDEFTRYVGWQSQADVPARLYESDVLVMPTIAQEALGRTAVEAMAASRPVVASRIGGLPFTVLDGATGLLCEPGDAADLAAKLEALLDDPALRERLGRTGRRRFEEHYAWDVIIENHYRPLLGRREPERAAYAPFIPDRVDHAALIAAAARFFDLEPAEVAARFRGYRGLHDAKGYARDLGEFKTLCLEEAFLLGLALAEFRPEVVVEIGTREGKSTRRLLDVIAFLGLESQVYCFDQEDRVEHFAATEASLTEGDVAGRFREGLLRALRPGLIFLDAHPYALVHEVVTETLAEAPGCVLAVHDCGRGLCNPRMSLSKDDPNVTSLTGVWERHVLAEVFGVDDPLSERLDAAETATHRLRIFDTPHGLALIIPTKGRAAPPGDSRAPARIGQAW